MARQRAGELELSEGELVIAKTALDELHDQLYVLACAVEDTDSDLAAVDGAPSAAELRRMLDWLLERGPAAGGPRSPRTAGTAPSFVMTE